MNKLIINKLYIFDLKDKKAYAQSFDDKINIITSEKKDGNNVGKSVIMKSIFHTLGADCYFSERFCVNNKTFLLLVSINNKKYYFLRFKKLFKIFDSEKNIIFKTTNRTCLSIRLKEFFDFYVELPNKTTGELEITPPAFMYLLNFLDQDKMEGPKFASFKSLEQYSNFKEKVLYNYFGIFNKEYYDLEKEIKNLTKQIENTKDEEKIITSMLDRIEQEIGCSNYSSNEISFEKEIENTKDEYVDIVSKLNESKKKIIKLKNDKSELEMLINNINENIHYNNGILRKFNNHNCPVCNSNVDELEFRYGQCDRNEDYLFLNQTIQVDLEQVIQEIEKERQHYNEISKKLSEYNEKLKQINKDVDNVIKHKGYIEMRDKLVIDYNAKKDIITNLEIKLIELKKKFKIFQDKKKKVKQEYYNLMSSCIDELEIMEIDKEKLKDIKNNFTSSGSNIPISTMIWYLNLLKIKQKFNPSAILFPLVLDSPNNGELSDESKKKLFKYIFSNYNNESQLIISTLGFESSDYDGTITFNIIELKNKAYTLLSEKQYRENIMDYKEIIDLNKE